ncbi:MAG: GGDEF domain-containing protein [Candidatus Eremiobacteraeota bacterium]|nr:GGDEF domain-containing protein [Candidatus Eremiobacteraeota bacterium]
MHQLLERQLARATKATGEVDLAALLRFVEAAYVESDVERDRTDRAMLLVCDEMDTLNAELRQLAHHDMLTGLPNRLSFAEFATRAMERAKDGESLAVLLVDLDRFKAVNDTLGHAMGDALLCEVSDRLRSAVRDGDIVARMGGDEFAVLQIGPPRTQDSEALARRIVGNLSKPYLIRGIRLTVGASVGVALAEDGASDDVDLLLLNADRALYRAKNEGRCTWRMYEPETIDETADAAESEARPDRRKINCFDDGLER